MKKFTALLPMKGHSERVPGKNLRLCAGKPLCSYVLTTLSAVENIDEILVNTDSEQIATFCKSFPKVTIVDRPRNLLGDYVSMNKIIAHDLSIARNEWILQTHSTNPLLKAKTIRAGMAQLEDGNLDSIFSVTRHQARFFTSNMEPINHDPSKLERTQDLEPVYEENSNLYLFSKSGFTLASEKRIGQNPGFVEMEQLEAIDIDEEKDFKLAELCICTVKGNE